MKEDTRSNTHARRERRERQWARECPVAVHFVKPFRQQQEEAQTAQADQWRSG